MEDFTLSELFQEVDAEIFFIISREKYLTRYGKAAPQKDDDMTWNGRYSNEMHMVRFEKGCVRPKQVVDDHKKSAQFV